MKILSHSLIPWREFKIFHQRLFTDSTFVAKFTHTTRCYVVLQFFFDFIQVNFNYKVKTARLFQKNVINYKSYVLNLSFWFGSVASFSFDPSSFKLNSYHIRAFGSHLTLQQNKTPRKMILLPSRFQTL